MQYAHSQTPAQFITAKPVVAADGVDGVLAVADFNGDGRADILTANNDDLIVLLQNSDGTFTPHDTHVPSFYQNLAIADLNGDGKLDLVLVYPSEEECEHDDEGNQVCFDLGGGMFQTALGNGDGTFNISPLVFLGQGSNPPDLAVGDINGDGSPDVVITLTDPPEVGGGGETQTFINDGHGNFHAGPQAPNAFIFFAGGDFNRDGKFDLISATSSGFGIMLGNGDGTFTPSPFTAATGPVSLAAVGDFNHDGRPDLIIAPKAGPALVYLNNGSGGFTRTQSLGSQILVGGTGVPQSISVNDFNHDGAPDLALSYAPSPLQPGGSAYVAVFTNGGLGSFSNPRIYNMGPSRYPAIVGVGDFNGDGNLDLLMSHDILDSYGNQFVIAFGNKTGSFTAPVVTSSTLGGIGYGTVVASGDFNGDGVPDIAKLNVARCAGCRSSVTIFPGSGKGFLNPGGTYGVDVTDGNIVVGDVNGDGKLDIVVTRATPYIPENVPLTPGPEDISVLLGNGDGTFQPARSAHLLGAPSKGTFNTQTYLVDVNHDGRLDLIGDWGVALGDGHGFFQAPIPLPSTITSVLSIAVGDINHDGNVDLVVTENGISYLDTLLGDGHGAFQIGSHQYIHLNAGLVSAILYDFNGDGVLDLAYFNTGIPALVVQKGKGDGTFAAATTYPISPPNNYNMYYLGSLVVADFNHDSHPDILVLYPSDFGDMALLPGSAAGTFSGPVQYYQGEINSPVAVDLTGDGAPDVVGTTAAGLSRMLNTGNH